MGEPGWGGGAVEGGVGDFDHGRGVRRAGYHGWIGMIVLGREREGAIYGGGRWFGDFDQGRGARRAGYHGGSVGLA